MNLIIQDSGNLNGAYKEIENGENGLDRLGLIRSFDGKMELNYWNDTYCDMLNGKNKLNRRFQRP